MPNSALIQDRLGSLAKLTGSIHTGVDDLLHKLGTAFAAAADQEAPVEFTRDDLQALAAVNDGLHNFTDHLQQIAVEQQVDIAPVVEASESKSETPVEPGKTVADPPPPDDNAGAAA